MNVVDWRARPVLDWMTGSLHCLYNVRPLSVKQILLLEFTKRVAIQSEPVLNHVTSLLMALDKWACATSNEGGTDQTAARIAHSLNVFV